MNSPTEPVYQKIVFAFFSLTNHKKNPAKNLHFPASPLSLHFSKKYNPLCIQPLDFCLWAVSLDSFTDKQLEIGEKHISQNLLKPEREKEQENDRAPAVSHSPADQWGLSTCDSGVVGLPCNSQQTAQVMLAVVPPSRSSQPFPRASCVLRSANRHGAVHGKPEHISRKHEGITEKGQGHSHSLKETARKLFWCRFALTFAEKCG